MANNASVSPSTYPEDESQRATFETTTQSHQKDVFCGFLDLTIRQLPKLSDLPKPDLIKTPAVIFGMTGAVFVALPTTFFRLAGFTCWMVANSLWVIQGRKVKDFYLIALFGFYLVTACLGIMGLVLEVV